MVMMVLMVRKVRRVMEVQGEHKLLSLTQHQVQQITVTYGGRVIHLIYMYIMLMVVVINGYQLHQMQH